MLILHVDDIADHAVCVPTLGSAIEDTIGRRCRHFLKMTNWIGPMLPRFVSHVQGRPWLRHRDHGDVCIVMLGEGKPVFESLVASSEPSVAIRICLYIDGPRRHRQSIMHEGCRGTRALLTARRSAGN